MEQVRLSLYKDFSGPEKGRFAVLEQSLIMLHFDLWGQKGFLGTFTTDTPGQLDVLGHNGDTLGVDGAQVGVLEQSYEVGFGGLLQCEHSRALEAEIALVFLGDFADEALEGEFADK